MQPELIRGSAAELKRRITKPQRLTLMSYRRSEMPKNIGLPQGFVRFGTLAHIILKLMMTDGPQSNYSITAYLEEQIGLGQIVHDKRAVAANLNRLQLYGFIVSVGMMRPPKTGGRAAHVFHYNPFRPKEFQIVGYYTEAEKQANYRERKRIKVNTVFQFRGRIKL